MPLAISREKKKNTSSLGSFISGLNVVRKGKEKKRTTGMLLLLPPPSPPLLLLQAKALSSFSVGGFLERKGRERAKHEEWEEEEEASLGRFRRKP